MAKALVATILLKNGQTPASFCLYSFFSNTNYTKNCRLQRDLNSDWRSRRRGRWPLDHHPGPNGGTISLFPRIARSHASMLLYWKRNRVNEKYLLILSYVKNWHFFVYFRSFQTNNTIFTTVQREKCPSTIRCWGIRTHDLYCRMLMTCRMYLFMKKCQKKKKINNLKQNWQVANSFSWAAPHGFDDSMFSAVKGGPEKSNRFFEQWVETVKATVPADRLLVFEVKQGFTIFFSWPNQKYLVPFWSPNLNAHICHY